jgi:hypothetical protein
MVPARFAAPILAVCVYFLRSAMLAENFEMHPGCGLSLARRRCEAEEG